MVLLLLVELLFDAKKKQEERRSEVATVCRRVCVSSTKTRCYVNSKAWIGVGFFHPSPDSPVSSSWVDDEA